MTGPVFQPGLALAQALYHEAVRPALDDLFPGLDHCAALLGPGSEVLGYDTVRSTDHDWGPRLLLFLRPADVRSHGRHIIETLEYRLPAAIAGWSTNFSPPVPSGSRVLEPADGGLVRHRVEVLDLQTWLIDRLGIDVRVGLRPVDWLAIPSQRLLEVTAGEVFHDGLGELTAVRRQLAWYPDDVWRYVLAAQWRRIAQQEPLAGRCAEVGDDLGSRVVTAGLVRDLMRLALLLGRCYPPYAKWLGTAFLAFGTVRSSLVPRCGAPEHLTASASLPDTAGLGRLLTTAVTAEAWPAREDALCGAYELLARAQNDLAIAATPEPTVRPFYDRPSRVLQADRFADALRDAITDPRVRALPPYAGGVDQLVDSTDVLTSPAHARAVTLALLDPGREKA